MKLLDQVRQKLRAGHYAYRTEQAYVGWVKRFILFHGKRHPEEMGRPEVERYLTHLAVEGRVSASSPVRNLSPSLAHRNLCRRAELLCRLRFARSSDE